MDHGSWIMDHGSWIMDHGSWIMDHGSWIMDHGSWIMDYGSYISLGNGLPESRAGTPPAAACPPSWTSSSRRPLRLKPKTSGQPLPIESGQSWKINRHY
jgi:hypothetical protein